MYYLIKFGAVGPHVQGEIVSAEQLAGADIGRLTSLGAIESADAPGVIPIPVEKPDAKPSPKAHKADDKSK